MDMTLSFYYYYLFLNELFKKNEQKKFDKKKASKTNKQIQNKTKIKWLVPSLHFTDPSLVSDPLKIRLR